MKTRMADTAYIWVRGNPSVVCIMFEVIKGWMETLLMQDGLWNSPSTPKSLMSEIDYFPNSMLRPRSGDCLTQGSRVRWLHQSETPNDSNTASGTSATRTTSTTASKYTALITHPHRPMAVGYISNSIWLSTNSPSGSSTDNCCIRG